MKVFISWSGEQSRGIANGFKAWLPRVIQAVKPWFSPEIEKGAKWANELDKALEGTKFGIVCLTPDNLKSPWLHYEAGALSKTEGARVWTFLHGLSLSDVSPPLSSYQATSADKSEVFRLVHSINERLNEVSGDPLPEAVLKDVFEDAWPKLERYLEQVEYVDLQASRQEVRKYRELLEEILELVRSHQERIVALEHAALDPGYFNRSRCLKADFELPESRVDTHYTVVPCKKCGREITIDDPYCVYCGQKGPGKDHHPRPFALPVE